jgi:AmmeMemoRadiSam system protein B
MLMLRAPVAAGTFYSIGSEELKRQIDACIRSPLGPKMIKMRKAVAAIVPHAGYEYSGPVAAWAYSRLESSNFIIVGTNHTGIGSTFSIMKTGLWKTPFGGVAVKEDMAERLMESCKMIEYDVLAHENEHSIEVQLPFLQYRFGSDFSFVPMVIINEFADDTLLKSCEIVGKSIADVVKKSKEKWTLLASSDLTHYEPQEIAEKIDRSLIRPILKMDSEKFFEVVSEKNASACGFGAIATVLFAAKELGAKKGELLKYATSGDVTQDLNSVVGYASILFS